MDAYASIWLTVGALLGIAIGWTLHTFYIRRYLKKRMPDHPEYKMFLDIINGKVNIEKDKKDTKV